MHIAEMICGEGDCSMLYKYYCFETKEMALAFKKWHGGILYDLEKELIKIGSGKMTESVAIWEGVDTDKYKYSVEWNEQS